MKYNLILTANGFNNTSYRSEKIEKLFEEWEGMNITEYNIFPHINAKPHMIEKIIAYEKENNFKITGLEDGDFILEYVQE